MLRQVLDEVRTELADFFCEDRDSFKLEECFKLFLGFCQRFRQGVLENEHRRQHELAAENRRRQREEQLALKRRQSAGTSPSKRKEYQLIMLMFSYIFSNSGFPHRHAMLTFNFFPPFACDATTGGQQGSTGGNDSDHVMDSLLLDIRCGFPMRDKVRCLILLHVLRHLN